MPEKNGYKADLQVKQYKADLDFKRTIGEVLADEAGAFFVTEDNKVFTTE